MNKKYILQKDDRRVYCIVDGDQPIDDELDKVFSIEKGHGLTAEAWGDTVRVRNYLRGDNLAVFPILEVLDTTEETVYRLTETEY